MNTNNIPPLTANTEEIDLMEEFDCDDSSEQRNSLVVAEEFDNLITEFDNSRVTEVVEDISVITAHPTTATAVYIPSVPPTMPVAETTTLPTVTSSIPMAETTTADVLYVQDYNNSLDDEMLVEAIEIMASYDTWPQGSVVLTSDDDTQVEQSGSQFVEYSTDPFESKHAMSDVQMLHNKMDTFMSDNNMVGSTDFMEDDDIEVFATMMQSIEQEHMNQTSDQVENKYIMQAMVMSNQQHVQEMTALQQQEEEINVQIGPICTAPFMADASSVPQFAVGSTNDSNASTASSNPTKKKCSSSKKKKEKKPTPGQGFGPENKEEYETQKNVLRQEATAKRTRTAGKFEKRKIEWMSITEAMRKNNNDKEL